MSLRIPPSQYRILKKFLHMPEATKKALVAELSQASPRLFIPKLGKDIAERTQISFKDVIELIGFFITLHQVRSAVEVSVDKFIEDIDGSLKKIRKEDPNISEKELESLRGYLREILSFEKSLGITSKAQSIRMQHDKVFSSSQVLTDIRPVFHSDPERTFEAAVLIHNLKINYRTATDEEESFFVALDLEDLKKLEAIIKRAIKKERNLSSWLSGANISYLDPEI